MPSKKKMKQQNKNKGGKNPNIQNYVPNKGKIVYGLKQFGKRKIDFLNCKSGVEKTIDPINLLNV